MEHNIFFEGGNIEYEGGSDEEDGGIVITEGVDGAICIFIFSSRNN